MNETLLLPGIANSDQDDHDKRSEASSAEANSSTVSDERRMVDHPNQLRLAFA